jgi:hypothetical protein
MQPVCPHILFFLAYFEVGMSPFLFLKQDFAISLAMMQGTFDINETLLICRYYGKGIYMTSSAFYSIRYLDQKIDPTLIIS